MNNYPHRKSVRLKNYDYRSNGYYFVTICTHENNCYFGTIENQTVNLCKLGKIAEKFWREIPDHYDYVEIDSFVIMPNHVYGIIILNKSRTENIVGTFRETSLSAANNGDDLSKIMSDLSPKKGSLSLVIRSYKSAVTRWSKLNHCDGFKWQSRFYEHIIRDEDSLNNIRKYIINNPKKWKHDSNYKEE